jgi:hypothetical protein
MLAPTHPRLAESHLQAEPPAEHQPGGQAQVATDIQRQRLDEPIRRGPRGKGPPAAGGKRPESALVMPVGSAAITPWDAQHQRLGVLPGHRRMTRTRGRQRPSHDGFLIHVAHRLHPFVSVSSRRPDARQVLLDDQA